MIPGSLRSFHVLCKYIKVHSLQKKVNYILTKTVNTDAGQM